MDGFYDGGGVYKARFMPSFEGEYTYETSGNFPEAESRGAFTVTSPSQGNHGPVRVVGGRYFVYEDATPYYSVGTTCYVWEHQPDAVYEKTLRELDKGYFNKIRFCVFPKHYIHNFHDPVTFPYEGTPMDCSGLNEENFSYFAPISKENHWGFSQMPPSRTTCTGST